MYNTSGAVFNLTEPNKGIVKYLYKLPKRYNDYEFSIENQMTFAAGKDAGIDVYNYESGQFLYTLRKDLHVTKLYTQNGKLTSLCTDGNGRYFLESVNTHVNDSAGETKAPLDYVNGVSGTETLNGNYYYSPLTSGAKDVSLGSFFIFNFTLPITLNDASQITLKGPNGTILSSVQAMDDALTLTPDLLNKNTAYTLTIKKDALLGEQGQTLEKDIVLNFQTGSNLEKHNGKLFFYDDKLNAFATKWKPIGSSLYFFNDSGEMQTSWLKDNKKTYYLDPKTGAMYKGWIQLNKKWYHFEAKNGFMQTGWIQIDKKWHYFDLHTGVLKQGWFKVNGKKQYSYPR